MDDASLGDLEQQRDRLYAELAATGDFRRGSISENYRRCGRPNCACAQPDHPGHGPRYMWTRTVAGRGTKGRQLIVLGGDRPGSRRGGELAHRRDEPVHTARPEP